MTIRDSGKNSSVGGTRWGHKDPDPERLGITDGEARQRITGWDRGDERAFVRSADAGIAEAAVLRISFLRER